MNLQEFREGLEGVQDGELLRYVQRCVCMTMANRDVPGGDPHAMLDLIYAECSRRGKERLYDKAYEIVCRKPDVCKILLA